MSSISSLLKKISSAGKKSVESKLFGYKITLDLEESIQRSIYFENFEPEETKWVKEILKPGMIFVDAGSNIGYFSLLASTLVGSAGKVYSFDPSTLALTHLNQTIRRNNITNITTLNTGLGDKEIYLQLYDQKDDTHSPSFLGDPKGDDLGRQRITTLDAFYQESEELRLIDLVKIDVEGYEPNVIAGMKNIISCHKVHRILIELNDDWLWQNGSSTEKIDNTLRSRGFVLEKKVQYTEAFGNYLYVYKGRDDTKQNFNPLA